MEIITSKSNPKIAEAKKLLQKKYRDEKGLFLVETKKVIMEALSHNLTPTCFFVKTGQKYDFLLQNIPIFEINEQVLSQITSIVNPDGFVGIFKKPQQKKEYLGGKFLILDGLQNPDNMGAIMRTALASGFEQIYTINCVDIFNPKVLRASMGNQFGLKISNIEYDDINPLFKNAKIYIADMDGQNIFEINNFEKNTGFVIGNEGNGISQQIKALVTEKISIPMQNGVESLNASVSASIIMYHIFSKKQH